MSSGFSQKLQPKCDKAPGFGVARPFSALNGFDIGWFAVEDVALYGVNAIATDRGPAASRSRQRYRRTLRCRETKKAPTVEDCGALVMSPLARRALWGENGTDEKFS